MAANRPDIYFFAVLPRDEIRSKTRKISREFADRFSSKAAAKSIPHITMVETFALESERLEILIRASEKKLSEFKVFSTELKNFAGFPEHTIYIAVTDKNPFQVLAYKLQSMLKHQFTIEAKVITNSHLTVGYKDLTPENFRLALAEFRSRPFQETLKVDSICLLKQDRGWKIIREFKLAGNTGYDSAQLELFSR